MFKLMLPALFILITTAAKTLAQCNAPVALPYFNGFENDSVGTVPQCLIYQSGGAFQINSYVRVGGPAWQGTKALFFYATEGPGYGQGWLFFPAMNFDSGKTYRVSVQYRSGGNRGVNDYPLVLKYGTSPTVAAMTTTLASTYFWPNVYSNLSSTFTGRSGQFYIGLQFGSSYDAPNTLTIDNFSVYEVMPAPCPLPIENLTTYTDGIDLTKAQFKWKKPDAFSPGDGFEWELRTTADAGSGSNGLVMNGFTTDTAINLNSLNQQTLYYLYVRGKCTGGTLGNRDYKRFKTSSPTSPAMAIPIPVTNYSNEPTASGPVFVPDLPLANNSVWYSFTPEQESNVLQIRNKRGIYAGGFLAPFSLLLKFDVYCMTNSVNYDSLLAASLPVTNTWLDSLCYLGACKKLNDYLGGDYAMPALVPGKKHLVRLWYNGSTFSPFNYYYIQSFDASIFKSDVWFGNSNGSSFATSVSTTIKALYNWNTIRNEVGNKEDMKMFTEIKPLGRNIGNVTGKCFRYSGKLRKNKYGTKVFDRIYSLMSSIQPNGNIKLRLYFTRQELQRFTDSTGKTLKDLRITHNNDPTYNPLPPNSVDDYLTGGTQIIPDTGTYDAYKYLEFETNKLGTFYIHGDSVRQSTITQHPTSSNVCPGTVVKLLSGANNGLPTPLVQWQQSSDGGTTWVNIANAKNANYNFIQTEMMNGILYRAAWSNTAGTVYSNPALIRNSVLTTLSASCCAGSNIIANANVGISQITWLYNGNPISTQSFNYSANAITSGGGNGSGASGNQFTNPFSVMTDTAGNVYVADAGNHRIQKFAPGNLNGVTVAGGNGAGAGANQLNNPRSVFVDAAGNLYIADAGNNRIQKWVTDSMIGVTVAGGNGTGNAANQLDFPHGVFVHGSENLYVADANNGRIQKFMPGNANGITVAGGNGAGNAANQLSYATSVFVDTAGNVYANDFNNHRVQKWAPGAVSGITVAGGNGAGSAANQLSSPRSFYVDCNSNIYVADQNNNRIQKWASGTTAGTTVAGTGIGGTGVEQLNSPASIYDDGKGNLFVADRINQRIQQFSLPKTSSYTALQGGAYKALINSTGCCSGTTLSVIINANPGPVTCPGSSAYFVSGSTASGNTYQWQVNTGNGFVNIPNNAIYTGATADTLKLNVPSTAWYGYTYRSLINGITYSPEYTLKFAVNWTGNSSTAWEEAANWSCGTLPDENTDVVVNTGLANYPLVNANVVCGSLKLMPGTAVTVKTGIKLNVKR